MSLTEAEWNSLENVTANVVCSIIKLNIFRSAAYIKMGQFSKAYQDAVKAKELNAEWPKVRNPDSLLRGSFSVGFIPVERYPL